MNQAVHPGSAAGKATRRTRAALCFFRTLRKRGKTRCDGV